MCIELTLTEQQRKTAEKLRSAADFGTPAWMGRVFKAIDGMGSPLATEFCDLAGVT